MLTTITRAYCAPVTGQAHLVCGDVMLDARTTRDAHVPPDDGFAWLDQTITLRTSRGASAIKVLADSAPATPLPDGRAALPDVVTGWACIPGRRPVILLGLTCARADTGGICQGEKEWFRVLDTSGRRLDEGFKPQDPRYPALFARLGLNPAGIAMGDATGD